MAWEAAKWAPEWLGRHALACVGSQQREIDWQAGPHLVLKAAAIDQDWSLHWRWAAPYQAQASDRAPHACRATGIAGVARELAVKGGPMLRSV